MRKLSVFMILIVLCTSVLFLSVSEVRGETLWEVSFVSPSGHPVVDFAVYQDTLYAAADHKLYTYGLDSWGIIDAPTYITSIESANIASREPPLTEWNRAYGGADWDCAHALVQTSEGGYALAGPTRSYGSGENDFWLVKTDASGNMQWDETYGVGTGTQAHDDTPNSLVQTADGGYAIAGKSGAAFSLVKTDSLGNLVWNKTYAGSTAYSLVQTADGGYAMAGFISDVSEDFWLVRTDANGNMQWNKTYGGTNSDVAHSLVQTADGGFAIAGTTWSFGAGGLCKPLLVKVDAYGNLQWSNYYEFFPFWGAAWSLVLTSDGGYAIAGYINNSEEGGRDDFCLIKTDASGNEEWRKTYDEIGLSDDIAMSLVQTSDGGYALAGSTSNDTTNKSDFWLVKTDSFGNHLWNRIYGGSDNDHAQALVQTEDGGLALAGYTRSFGAGNCDFWLVKTGTLGSPIEKLIVGGQGGLYCYDGASFSLVFTVPVYIRVLGVYESKLYAGTFLDKPPKLYYCSGSADSPSDWHVDSGFSTILNFSGPFGSIDSFAAYGNAMFVSSGGSVYSSNGTEWSIVKTYDDVYAFCDMKVYNNKLCLATRDQAWRKPYYQGYSGFNGRVIEFDGENWTTVFDHDYWIFSLETYNGKLYVGTANRIYTYNGTDWSTSFNAVDGAYYAISFTTFNGKIYVGMGNGYILADPEPETVTSGTPVVPEYPSLLFLPLFIATTFLAVILYRRKRLASAQTSLLRSP
jgi:hypothetical protein